MKVGDAIRLIELDGWFLIRTRGSHRHTSIPTNQAESPLLANILMTLLPER
jgi:predicted RNA binding protein YcfA (HicA-like mRNA interferase family)